MTGQLEFQAVLASVELLMTTGEEKYRQFPFLWQLSEYVISGAANFIFYVLAAEDINSHQV